MNINELTVARHLNGFLGDLDIPSLPSALSLNYSACPSQLVLIFSLFCSRLDSTRLCYTKEDADREVKDIRSRVEKFNGSFVWLKDKIYYYKFNDTIAACKAKVTDFPPMSNENTDKLLPPVQTKCVDIDVDVGVVPKKNNKTSARAIQRDSKKHNYKLHSNFKQLFSVYKPMA